MRVQIMVFLFVWQSISSCAIATPFQKSPKFDTIEMTPETIVILALTEVEITGSSADKSTFWDRVTSVRKSLDVMPGYLGGAIRREILGPRAWTQTVWRSEEELDLFVASREHERAMREGAPAVKTSKFYRGRHAWKELPMGWDVVEKLIEEEGRKE